jgi:hypothetical protein
LAEAYSRGRVLAEALPDMRQVFTELAAAIDAWAAAESAREVPVHA